MLQRSPTYVVARPAEDALANKLRKNLSAKLAYHMIRWRNVLLGMYFFQLCRRRPDRAKQLILGGVKMALGPEYDVGKHFTPRYNPWEQRLCLVPDGDLFKSIRDKRASVVTNEIDTFTKGGIKLGDGSELEADIIVTATGLNLQVLGGLEVSVDGRTVDFARTLNYKGMMYSDIPNMASAFGYTNASWTLKCDLTCEYVCRLINTWTATTTGGACRTTSILTSRNCRRWISPPATYSARSPNCPSRVRNGRGGCIRITRSTSSHFATARSTTG
jgi:cation diffusion facilitator CzcD-associated flavoprotein CzcO